MSQYYYVTSSNQQAGPYDLNALVAQGITPQTLVWKEGLSGWVPAAQVPEVAAALRQQSSPRRGPSAATRQCREAYRHVGLGHPEYRVVLRPLGRLRHCLCGQVACRRGARRHGVGAAAFQAVHDFHHNRRWCGLHWLYYSLYCRNVGLICPASCPRPRAGRPCEAPVEIRSLPSVGIPPGGRLSFKSGSPFVAPLPPS